MSLEAARNVLSREQVAGVPTDTVYGLAADPVSPSAVNRLFALKGRGEHLPLVVLAAAIAQVEQLVEIPDRHRPLLEKHWPGPLTAVLNSKVILAPLVGDHSQGTLAVRIPDQPLLLELLDGYGPLAVTSANRSGQPPVADHAAARRIFGDGIEVYLPGHCPGGVPSTVADLTVHPPQTLRLGPAKITP